jgi:hypothetical protein
MKPNIARADPVSIIRGAQRAIAASVADQRPRRLTRTAAAARVRQRRGASLKRSKRNVQVKSAKRLLSMLKQPVRRPGSPSKVRRPPLTTSLRRQSRGLGWAARPEGTPDPAARGWCRRLWIDSARSTSADIDSLASRACPLSLVTAKFSTKPQQARPIFRRQALSTRATSLTVACMPRGTKRANTFGYRLRPIQHDGPQMCLTFCHTTFDPRYG